MASTCILSHNLGILGTYLKVKILMFKKNKTANKIDQYIFAELSALRSLKSLLQNELSACSIWKYRQ